MRDASPPSPASAEAFVAAHRLVAETAAGRPVALQDGGRWTLAAPLDGGPLLSPALGIAAPRAAHLGLSPAAAVLTAPAADAARFLALASAPSADLSGIAVAPGGPAVAAATELAKLAERLPAVTLLDVPEPPPGTLTATVAQVLAFRRAVAATLQPVATAAVPLAAGATAQLTAYRNAVGGTVSALVFGAPGPGALVRVHSSCVTGDIFGSLRCDCGAQLRLALARLAQEGGVLLYTAQEGRGIGLVNKLRAYALQDAGLDTVDANLALGFHDDEREYAAAAAVLHDLGLTRVRLLSNNPNKAAALAAHALGVEPVPLVAPATAENARYLETKRTRSGHRL